MVAKIFLYSVIAFFSSDCVLFAVDHQDAPSQSASIDFADGLYARKMYGPAISEYEKFIRSNPASPELAAANFRLADSYYFSKNYEQAVSCFDNFVKKFPQDPRVSVALFRTATAKFSLKDYKGANDLFFNLAKDDSDPNVRSGALFYLGKIYEASGDTQRMTVVLNKIISNYPQSEYAAYSAFTLGDLNLKTDHFPEAIEAFKIAALKNNPLDIAHEAQFKLAGIYFSQKDFANARGAYEGLFGALKNGQAEHKLEGRDKELLEKSMLGLFYCDYGTHNLESAAKVFKDNEALIAQGAARGEIYLVLSGIWFDQKKYEEALGFVEKILSDASADTALKEKAHFRKSKILKLLNRSDEAVAELEKVIASSSAEKARAMLEKGDILSELKKYTEALKVYQDTLQTASSAEQSQRALFQLAVTQLQAGDRKAARESFMKFVGSYPKEEDAQKALLEAVQIDLEDQRFGDAKEGAAGFLSKFPSSPLLDMAHYKLGMAHTGLKDFTQAAQAFSAVTRMPSSKLLPEAVYGAAVSFDKVGQTKEAVDYYEKFVQGYPQHPLFKDAYVRLGSLCVLNENFERAGAIYQDVLLNHENYMENSKAAFWLVRYLLDKSDYATIGKILEILPSRFPKENLDHESYFFKGEIAMGLKQFKEAVIYYQKAIGTKPDGPYAAHSYLGIGIASAALQDRAGAEDNFNQALRFDYELEVALRARFEIASLRLGTGNLDEAAKAFMLVAILYDDAKYCPLALYKAGECFDKTGHPEDAQKAREELKSRYPSSEWAKK